MHTGLVCTGPARAKQSTGELPSCLFSSPLPTSSLRCAFPHSLIAKYFIAHTQIYLCTCTISLFFCNIRAFVFPYWLLICANKK